MFPTVARLSKASRRPLTSKKGNKDFYKGTRQAFLPGGHRTGAPGKHVIRGKAKYRLIDEKVRVFVAPPISEINNSPLKPYVATHVHLKKSEERAAFGRFREPGGLTPQHFLKVLRENAQKEHQKFLGERRTTAAGGPEAPSPTVSKLSGLMEKVGLR
ncbi:mitochondrial ribosomal protein of the large subunit [Moniliophthora roreri MCA 2997]|uniref:Mitochondrial ribosomal protein of the large subunit n=2 Tax=Moniliophthora roreri TaxID=221103 RepID=V2Y4N2_MONRO|nr:mitochondrial ribosomal protein of the large subunit [Moniliophthora roreri MCA 2997]